MVHKSTVLYRRRKKVPVLWEHGHQGGDEGSDVGRRRNRVGVHSAQVPVLDDVIDAELLLSFGVRGEEIGDSVR